MLELDATIVVIMILFTGLAWFVSRFYLRPVGVLLEERRQSTVGVVAEAEKKMAEVETHLRHYRERIQQARAENYKQQEEQRRQALELRQQRIGEGRQQYDHVLSEARREISLQTARAKEWMAREAESLSSEIARRLLA